MSRTAKRFSGKTVLAPYWRAASNQSAASHNCMSVSESSEDAYQSPCQRPVRPSSTYSAPSRCRPGTACRRRGAADHPGPRTTAKSFDRQRQRPIIRRSHEPTRPSSDDPRIDLIRRRDTRIGRRLRCVDRPRIITFRYSAALHEKHSICGVME